MDASENHNQRMIEELASELKKLEDVQNKVRIDEFLIYKDLFTSTSVDTLSRKEIVELSARFFGRFNVYKAIEVYDNNDKLLFKIPQLFVPINNVEGKYLSAVDRFRTEGTSEIPKYSAEATQGLLGAIMKSQQNVTQKGFSSFREYIKSLTQEYNNDVELFSKFKSENSEEPESEKEIEQSGNISDVEGLSWG